MLPLYVAVAGLAAGFRFAPAAAPPQQALNLVNSTGGLFPGVTTWGGSVVASPPPPTPAGTAATTHHMYASAFSGGCGLAGWETNSFVIHASSTTGPGGPFVVQDTAVPSFVSEQQRITVHVVTWSHMSLGRRGST